ncbi:hypothetical protein DFH01_09975 [Falsiroseomonas bella]|uniref:Cell division protein FtsL n=1 Tax=Falsiroseomonas bella TaxID=2184016 RepID=A0A317FFM2_9PROT|nr:hypothetical protein [Falsiroseomonas bella]PWS37182.1 hypothetical protein DFH01_09975 [Falsiroseomonas bella]
MIRPLTVLCFLAFAGAGAWLYQVKHAVAVKDRELLEIRRETEQARQRIDILRAEWALLNEPDRLRQTATHLLTLEPMQPQHFVRLGDLGRRLPNAVAFAGAPDLFAPAPSTAPATMLATAPERAPAAQPASSQAETPAPQALVATLAAQRAEQASRIAEASAPRPTPVRAAPRPQPQPVVRPAVHTPPPAEPAPRPTRIAAQEPAVVSALGGATALGRPMLAPPVPIAPAAAATLR